MATSKATRMLSESYPNSSKVFEPPIPTEPTDSSQHKNQIVKLNYPSRLKIDFFASFLALII